MTKVMPRWCADFRCIAGACCHSCCIGWEIDIDEESLRRYDKAEGAFGERLRGNIERGETAHFRLGPGERCPFLNERGLCDMILELGESSLCQICTDHPRFYTWLPERTEMGLGLCCEEACRLLLESEDYTSLIEDGNDTDELTEEREALFAALRGEGSIMERLERMIGQLPEYDMAAFAELLLGFEIMNTEWEAALRKLLTTPELMGSAMPEHDGERLSAYLLYRYYVNYAEDGYGDMPILFACVSMRLLAGLYAITAREKGRFGLADRINWLRLWSAELEYSEENMDAIVDFLYA